MSRASDVAEHCREIASSEADAEAFCGVFAEELARARENLPATVERFFKEIPHDWHSRAPVYCVYPHSILPGKGTTGTLHDTARLIEHAKGLGAGGMYVLPVFDSPGGDAGFDVRSWNIRESLGGDDGFDVLIKASIESGFPVILDLPLNHVSIEHAWFKKLLSGDKSMAERFIRVPDDWEKTGEREIEGRTYAVYRNGDGVETPRWILFPHASRDHFLEAVSGGERVRLYHTYYPFQPDVNLRHPEVFRECLRLMGRLIGRGVLGFRLDAVQHWMKRDGTTAEGLPETFAFVRVLNAFAKALCAKAKLLPEVGAGTREAARYLGEAGDGFWGFETRAAIPEAVFLRSAAPYWAAVERVPGDLPGGGTVLGMVMHHDELPGEFLMHPEKTVPAMLEKGGVPFRDGTSVSGRLAPLLDDNPRRIALAYWLMFMFPCSTPTLYYGEEAGLGNDPEHARTEAENRRRVLSGLGAGDWGEDKAFDSRDVHRQCVALETLRNAVEKNHPVCEVFRRLSALRRERPSLRGTRPPGRIDAGGDAVVAMLRVSDDGKERTFGAANLSEADVELRVPFEALRDAYGEGGGVLVRREGGGLILNLPAESFILAGTETD